MKTRKFVLQLFRLAKLKYQKFSKKFKHTQAKQNLQTQKNPHTIYSYKIYTNPSDYYLNRPTSSIFKPLSCEYNTEEIRKIQNFINSLSLKSAIKTELQEEKIDFDNIQNYVTNPNYTIR